MIAVIPAVVLLVGIAAVLFLKRRKDGPADPPADEHDGD